MVVAEPCLQLHAYAPQSALRYGKLGARIISMKESSIDRLTLCLQIEGKCPYSVVYFDDKVKISSKTLLNGGSTDHSSVMECGSWRSPEGLVAHCLNSRFSRSLQVAALGLILTGGAAATDPIYPHVPPEFGIRLDLRQEVASTSLKRLSGTGASPSSATSNRHAVVGTLSLIGYPYSDLPWTDDFLGVCSMDGLFDTGTPPPNWLGAHGNWNGFDTINGQPILDATAASFSPVYTGRATVTVNGMGAVEITANNNVGLLSESNHANQSVPAFSLLFAQAHNEVIDAHFDGLGLGVAPGAELGSGTIQFVLHADLECYVYYDTGEHHAFAIEQGGQTYQFYGRKRGWYKESVSVSKFKTADVDKVAVLAQSIDTRKAYGNPNADGHLPGDPNAELDHVAFSGYRWKGGLFIGCAPYQSTGDESGYARIQVQLPDVASNQWSGRARSHNGDLLVLYDKGPSMRKNFVNASDDVTIGDYFPAITDTDIPSWANLTWNTRWASVEPTEQGSDSYHLAHQTYRLMPSNADHFVPFEIPSVHKRVVLALENEVAIRDYFPIWRYFLSASEAPYSASVLEQTSGPHIWRVGVGETGAGE